MRAAENLGRFRPAKSTSKVEVLAPDPSTDQALTAAFHTGWGLSPTCSTATVPGTVWVATIKATGVSFAVAGFKPVAGCNGVTVSPFSFIPPPPVGVFERQPGKAWVMNSDSGKPFPCPPFPANQGNPGLGSPTVPKEVLDAWRIPYFSPGCVSYLLRLH